LLIVIIEMCALKIFYLNSELCWVLSLQCGGSVALLQTLCATRHPGKAEEAKAFSFPSRGQPWLQSTDPPCTGPRPGTCYDSDEIVLFKYCAGSCQRARTNHDLTLSKLLHAHPCCRPTRYEPVSFMDVQNTWQTVEKLSAAECSCVG
uniref:Artemin a n=1 Tax=Erpetoichthys calabaricus TaxID=27687 RepID=A0A8C4SAZ8_ERPCA